MTASAVTTFPQIEPPPKSPFIDSQSKKYITDPTKPVTPTEVQHALMGTSLHSTPGPAGITWSIVPAIHLPIPTLFRTFTTPYYKTLSTLHVGRIPNVCSYPNQESKRRTRPNPIDRSHFYAARAKQWEKLGLGEETCTMPILETQKGSRSEKSVSDALLRIFTAAQIWH